MSTAVTSSTGTAISRTVRYGRVSRRSGKRSTFVVFIVFFVTLVVAFRSVILVEIQLVGVFAVPAERDAPRATHGQCVPALSIAL